MPTDYAITTWADGFGRWHARIDFPHGAGNTGAGERLIANARRAAQTAIRQAITGEPFGRTRAMRLRYDVVANRENPSSGALTSLTIAEH